DADLVGGLRLARIAPRRQVHRRFGRLGLGLPLAVRGARARRALLRAVRAARHGFAGDQLAAAALAAAFSAALAVAAVLAAASLASLALAASSAWTLRSLRGTAFSGLLRGLRLATPALSRKRMTRSDGCAPFFIHACTFSRSSLSRSVLSFGSNGLKWPSRSMKRPSRGLRESATTT